MDTFDLRITALEYALNLVVAELEKPHPDWNERVEGLCEAASMDYAVRMRQAGVPLEPETEAFMAAIMRNYLKST
ncbi:MAG: hypothetical protein R8J41_00360 [Alphaproteobacteria bacterium]|nr:hypothetical protein [Alphaproteobacteria bacterium]